MSDDDALSMSDGEMDDEELEMMRKIREMEEELARVEAEDALLSNGGEPDEEADEEEGENDRAANNEIAAQDSAKVTLSTPSSQVEPTSASSAQSASMVVPIDGFLIELFYSSVAPQLQSQKEAMRLRNVLFIKNVMFREYDVALDPARLREMQDRTQLRQLPQLHVNGRFLGVWDEIEAMEESGQLDKHLVA